MGRKNRIFQV